MSRNPRYLWAVAALGIALASVLSATIPGAQPPSHLPTEIFSPPPELSTDFGTFRSPLRFDDGREVRTRDDWARRRQELMTYWHRELGPWPALLERPGFSIVRTEELAAYTQHRVRVEIAK